MPTFSVYLDRKRGQHISTHFKQEISGHDTATGQKRKIKGKGGASRASVNTEKSVYMSKKVATSVNPSRSVCFMMLVGYDGIKMKEKGCIVGCIQS